MVLRHKRHGRDKRKENNMTKTYARKINDLGEPKFELGTVVSTPGAISVASRSELIESLNRHARGDWGEICDHDRKENEFSLQNGFRLFSVYRTESGIRYWIITEADRSVTTILLPHEY